MSVSRDSCLDKDDHGLNVATLPEYGVSAVPIPIPILHHGVAHERECPSRTTGKEAVDKRL